MQLLSGIRPVSLTDRTRGFGPRNKGAIPLRGTNAAVVKRNNASLIKMRTVVRLHLVAQISWIRQIMSFLGYMLSYLSGREAVLQTEGREFKSLREHSRQEGGSP